MLWAYVTLLAFGIGLLLARRVKWSTATKVTTVLPPYEHVEREPTLEAPTTVAFEIDAPEQGTKLPVELANWREQLALLDDGDAVVERSSRLRLYVDYSLERPVAFVLEAQGSGFTRLDLLIRIGEIYEHMHELGTFGLSSLDDVVVKGARLGTHEGERWTIVEMGS